MSHIKRTWQVENTWSCPSCSAANRGRDLDCQTCGARKDAKVVDDLSGPEAPEVTDPARVREAEAGANWQCEYCANQERNLHGECAHCGGPKSRAAGYQDVTYKRVGRAAVRNVRAGGNITVTSMGADADDGMLRAQVGSLRSRRWPKVVATLAVGGLVWLIVWLCMPRVIDARVSDLSWIYTINLRERVQLHNDGQWGRPGGEGFYEEPAFNLTCASRYYGDEDCHPHDCRPHSVSYDCNYSTYDCNCRQSCSDNKNGYSTCSERCDTCSRHDTCSRTEYDTCYDSCPVYRDWCSFDYYDWPVKATQQTGGHGHDVRWPDVRAEGDLQRLQPIEQYAVRFRVEEDSYDYAPETLAEYTLYNVGDVWRLEIGKVRGKIKPVERQQAENE